MIALHWRRIGAWPAIWAMVVWLAGCAGPGGFSGKGVGNNASVVSTSSAVVVAPIGSEAVVRPGSGTGTAVHTLLVEASRAARAGHLQMTEALLERALHIEPRNPILWYYLARLRVRQGRFAQARTLAARSNTLAGTAQRLRADNWALIAYASERLGDPHTAQRARARAARLRGSP